MIKCRYNILLDARDILNIVEDCDKETHALFLTDNNTLKVFCVDTPITMKVNALNNILAYATDNIFLSSGFKLHLGFKTMVQYKLAISKLGNIKHSTYFGDFNDETEIKIIYKLIDKVKKTYYQDIRVVDIDKVMLGYYVENETNTTRINGHNYIIKGIDEPFNGSNSMPVLLVPNTMTFEELIAEMF